MLSAHFLPFSLPLGLLFRLLFLLLFLLVRLLEPVVAEGDRAHHDDGQRRVHEDYDGVELPERARLQRLLDPPD